MLFWAMILGFIALGYYVSRGEYGPEFMVTLFLVLIAAGGASAILRQMRRELR